MKSQLRGDQTAKKVDIQRRPLGLDRISCRWITLVLERLLCLCNTRNIFGPPSFTAQLRIYPVYPDTTSTSSTFRPSLT
jgi:hypothetical protein